MKTKTTRKPTFRALDAFQLKIVLGGGEEPPADDPGVRKAGGSQQEY